MFFFLVKNSNKSPEYNKGAPCDTSVMVKKMQSIWNYIDFTMIWEKETLAVVYVNQSVRLTLKSLCFLIIVSSLRGILWIRLLYALILACIPDWGHFCVSWILPLNLCSVCPWLFFKSWKCIKRWLNTKVAKHRCQKP